MNQLVTFLKKFQSKDGSFLSYSSSSESFRNPEFMYSTICTTAFVIHALNNVKELAGVGNIQKKSAEFLLKNKSEYETWNYWAKENPEYSELPYPDDTDDTFAALAALYTYDSELVSGASLAHIVKGLTALEKQEGGPYFTWYTKSKKAAWKDIDVVANAQIAHFLKMQGVELPHLSTYFHKLIDTRKIYSQYYPSQLHTMYFMARTYKDELLGEILIEYLKKNNGKLNPLEIALGVSSLVHLDKDHSILYQELLKLDPASYTKAYPFCIDPTRNGKKYFSGSPAITVAAIIEALTLHKSTRNQSSSNNPTSFDTAYKRVLHLAERFPKHLRDVFEKQVSDSLDTKAGKQCVLAPEMVAKAFNANAYEDIFFAQACGWIAYEIFDDCVDEKNVNNLGIAIMLYGEMNRIFSDIFSNDSEYRQDFLNRLSCMNSSLLEEAEHINKKERETLLRNPDWMLHKSCGYMLGPLAVMHTLEHSLHSKETQATVSYFEHLILALQLSDDAHDWQEDMENFRRNGVIEILPELATMSKTKSKQCFWESGIEIVLEKIQEHCRAAREAYQSVEITEILDEPIKIIDDMCAKTLRERNTAKEFLQEY